jgi:hypothetical protein
MSADMKWAELFAGSVALHERTMRMASKEAAQPGAGDLEPIISGADDSLAAIAIIRGPAAGRDFPPAVASVVARIGRQLQMFRDGIADRSALELLSLLAISESVGAPLKRTDYDVDYRFKRFLTNKVFSRTEKMTVALLALDLGRIEDARLVVSANSRGGAAVPGDPLMLVKVLAAASGSQEASAEIDPAFDAFLVGFPGALKAEKAEWRQLMLSARLVLGKLGGIPAGEVAEHLHRRIKKIAEEESA